MCINHILKDYPKLQTPYFLYCYDSIEKTANALLNSLPKESNLLFSVKANPNPSYLKILEEKGILFETASEGELMHLVNNNIAAHKIVCSGQGKTKSYFEAALNLGVLAINVESSRELSDLSKLSEALNKVANILVRINPIFNNSESALIMGGAPSPYGIDEDLFYKLIDVNNFTFNGLFMYAGSNYHNFENIVSNTKYLFELAERLYNTHSIKLKYLDFGGGFGVPEFNTDSELDITKMSNDLNYLFKQKLNLDCFSDVRKYFFESGRYLAARCAVLVTKVIDIKISRGKKFLILDGGINCLGIKQFEYRRTEPKIELIKQNNCIESDLVEEVCLVGTTCTPIDISHKNASLQHVEIGDLICFKECGAYSLEFSPKSFCGQINPAEYIYKNRILYITRDYGDINKPYGSFLPMKIMKNGE